MADEIAGATVLIGGDQGVDDHYAGRGGDGDVHGRLAGWVVGAVAGGEQAIQQRHNDEAAAETEQHSADTGQAAEAGQ